MIDFRGLKIGKNYSRSDLIPLLGYKKVDAIRRGVVTPKGESVIILFVTKEKSKDMTPYDDYVEDNHLFWDGEKGHGSDDRIISKRDDIHVFFREKSRSDFRYFGRALLLEFIRETRRPSRFKFRFKDAK